MVTIYLLPAVNLQLRPRLLALAPGTRIVSHDWDMGDWAPERTVVVDVPDKIIGREKLSRVHLWIVPAQVHGLWCAPGVRLEVTQRFQQFSATLTEGAAPAPLLVFDGRITGRELVGGVQAQMRLHATADELRLETSALPGGVHAGRTFNRAGPRGCE